MANESTEQLLPVCASEFYDLVQCGDYVEIIWIDGRKQVKVFGALQLVGQPKPIVIVSRNGSEWVLYRLAPEDRAIVLVKG
jgi:hypothetical protein